MKYLIIALFLLSASCAQGESFYSKDCIYNSWADGKTHCSRYNLVKVDEEVLQQNQRQYYGGYYYPRGRYYPTRYY